MLGKLMKYEMSAVGRRLGPIYLALPVAAALMGFTTMRNNTGTLNETWFTVTSVFIFTAVAIAVAVMTLIVLIQRFNQNLLGDEGYFTLTLPVDISTHIWNKTLSAGIWSMIAGAVAIISVLIIFFTGGELSIADLKDIHLDFNVGTTILLMIEMLILSFIGTCVESLKIYLSIAIGKEASKHTTLLAIAVYIGISTAESMLGNALAPVIARILSRGGMTWVDRLANLVETPAGMSLFLLLVIIGNLIIGAVFFVGCDLMLKNKLNLN